MPLSIRDLICQAAERHASDIHLKAASRPMFRIDGDLELQKGLSPQSAEEIVALARSMMTSRQVERFKDATEMDIAFGVEGIGRLRVSIFQQRGNPGMVIRLIPRTIRTLEELSLPRVMERICEERRGLVLVTGATGSGKSTTLAAMVDRINSTRAEHIITVEDPIEFLHEDKKGFVNQREIGLDTPAFATALRAALRQDPNVILVGEMRDLETISTALLAAETGHLVLSTLHTLDATETVQRIVASFPLQEHKRVRLQLAATVRAVISQRLVPRVGDAGRVPAVEVMIVTSFIRDCILNPDKTRLIPGAIAAGASPYGMQTFDQSLFDLYSRQLITLGDALARSSNPDDFRLRVQGIRSASESAKEEMERAIAEFERSSR